MQFKSVRSFIGAKDFQESRQFYLDWGNEFFLHDPSGILWHIGKFH